jgi:hypothetical protein
VPSAAAPGSRARSRSPSPPPSTTWSARSAPCSTSAPAKGPWRAPLLKLRPKLDYLGFDSSEYAVQRFGARRNLHFARFADFEHLRPCAPVDLLVCSDVLHYLPTRELDRGLSALAGLCGGVAFLETFTRADGIDGDTEGFHARPAGFYRERFARVGLAPLGSHLWLSPVLRDGVAALELPG